MQRRGDDQPTVFTDHDGHDRSPSSRCVQSSDRLPTGIARRTGVVFVHGIGTQTPGETFLDWSGAIVELLADWREARDGTAAATTPDGRPRSHR